MSHRSRLWISGPGIVVALFLSAGCVKGVGEACEQHAECEAGLACVEGACGTCGRGVACLAVDLVVQACSEDRNPMESVSEFRLRITGEGMSPMNQVVHRSAGNIELAKVPMGKARQVRIEGYATADATEPLSVGTSAVFDLDPKKPVAPVVVYLRKADAFSRANVRTEPTTCTDLVTARAGHSATPLSDGRVLIAGGYAFNESGETIFLRTTELFDPQTGRIASAKPLNQGRTGHTATLLPDGRVFVAGGEAFVSGQRSALVTAEIYDPAGDTWSLLTLGQPRMRHAAVLLSTGEVMLSGGHEQATQTQPLNTTLLVNPSAPAQSAARPGPNLQERRADHIAMAISGDRVMIIGGVNASGAISTYEMFGFLGGNLVGQEQPQALGGGRAQPYAFPFQFTSGQGLLVLGHPGTGGELGWDWVKLGGQGEDVEIFADGAVPTGRFGSCAAATENGAIIVGGTPPGIGTAVETAELFLATDDLIVAQPASGVLSVPRTRLACTTLADGSVLVTGGDLAGQKKVSSLIEIYRP